MSLSRPGKQERLPASTIQLQHIPPKVLWTVTLLFPFLLFAITEIVLRLLNVGPNLALFEPRIIGGKTYYTMNPAVKGRYFSSVEFNPATSPDAFEMPKPTGTFRIFCLGESTTVGFPYGYEGSFPRFLQQRLAALFPKRTIEVINLGMTATNSFTTLDIGRELVDYQPDLLIVYDGHNEFYGALGVASRESVGRSRWVTELYLSLVHVRTFVALREIYDWLQSVVHFSAENDEEGTMMERLAIGKEVRRWSSDYVTALESFRANLSDLASRCSDRHIPILFGTQVSNLRDIPPFVSGTSALRDSSTRARIDDDLARGRQLASAEQFPAAIARFDSALARDSTRADARYLLAQAMDSLHRYADAEREYIAARDFDELRFRASTDFNDGIKHLDVSPGAGVTDVEHVFRAQSPDSLIGSTLILEHLHPTAWGAFLIAKAYAASMRCAGLLAPESEWLRCDTISDSTLWALRTLTPLDVVAADKRVASLTSHWPFTKAFTPHESDPATATWLGPAADKMIDGEWSWERAHEEVAGMYRAMGDLDGAKEEYRALSAESPLSVSPLLRLGEVYVAMKQYALAAETFQRSLAIAPTYTGAVAAGSIHAVMNDSTSAMKYYRQAERLATSDAETREIRQLMRTTEQQRNR